MKSALDIIALILVLVGGLNWGLVGAFNFNVVEAIFGSGSLVSMIIYILVGISAIYGAFVFFQE
ncbi:DUF378 domain-containing protein [Candidatus Pacearchaeota archaeon]|nr:DUF378 domain-containing protein [Candidatus Pacearchaeota archaeon]